MAGFTEKQSREFLKTLNETKKRYVKKYGNKNGEIRWREK